MEYTIRYKDDFGEFVNEESIDKNKEYSKEYYSKENELIKTEIIKNECVTVVRYEKCDGNFQQLLEKHLEVYGNVAADFMGTHEITRDGYKVRGHLYDDGKLNFVREIYIDMDDDIVKEVSLSPQNKYEPTMVEYYEYDDDKELIGITQKTTDGKIISHMDF